MYIRKIQLENIRGFRSGDLRVDLDLQRPDGSYAGWTVLAGRNGSGKSTFLKALASAVVGPRMASILQQSFSGWIREGHLRAEVQADLVSDEQDIFEKANDPSKRLRAALVWHARKPGQEPTIEAAPRSELDNIAHLEVVYS